MALSEAEKSQRKRDKKASSGLKEVRLYVAAEMSSYLADQFKSLEAVQRGQTLEWCLKVTDQNGVVKLLTPCGRKSTAEASKENMQKMCPEYICEALRYDELLGKKNDN